MTIQVDVAILGGGIGGYTAAMVAAQMGKQVVIIERDKLGGTCLHRGCIPSKALLRSAQLYRQALHGSTFGVQIEGIKLDFERVQGRKQEVVEQLHRGVKFLMHKHRIELIHGHGRVMGPSIFSPKSGSVAVECHDGKETMTIIPRQLILATGSRPRALPGLLIDGNYVVTTDEALEWTTLPRRVAILGGGVIGMEWASMLIDFGVNVDVIEVAARIVPQEDEDISCELERQLKRRGVRIHTQVHVQAEAIQVDEAAGEVHLLVEAEGVITSIVVDKLLVCIGRQANIDQIGLENAGIECVKDYIRVNEWMQTNEPHIYALGDVVGGLQLAHAAAAEARVAVGHYYGQTPVPLDHRRIPRCIYSMPEVASLGWTEQEAKAAQLPIQVSMIPFQAIGKAIVNGDIEGWVKVIADAKTSDLLGVHIIGPQATELISEVALAKWLDATPWEMGHVIHPHPSLSEIIGEAMLAIEEQ